MLTKKQIKEIREHLEKAQNPIFYFDNDPDGLCSFLLLRKFVEKGKGVPVKSFPDLNADYLRKVEELNCDYIFILDKPVVAEEFFKKAEQMNIPIVWIDHHAIDKKTIPRFVNYYNPIFNRKKSNEPVTALCYQIADKDEDLWIAVAGCISDSFIPDFYSEFLKKYPDLGIKAKKPFDILYNSQIGQLSQLLAFGLKDRTTNVINMMKFLIKVKTPYEVLEENSKNRNMHEKFNQINRKFNQLVKRARENSEGDTIFFQYSGDLSISSEVSNKLMYLFPDKIIIVARVFGGMVSISARGDDVRDKVLKAIEGLENATGGGHKEAVGARVMEKDFEKFKEKLKYIVENRKV